MTRFGHSLPKEKLGGIGLPSWLPDWLTGKDVKEIQGPVYIPPRGNAGGYRKELAADIARQAKDPFTQRDIQSAVIAGADVVPLMGEDVGIKETGEYWKKGDYINAVASGLGTVLGIAPVVGDVGGKLVKEGGKKLAKGLGEVSEHLPNVEKTISAVVDPVAPKGLGVRAYHGSPHSFEEFDISKIGTGEGAQAYGHGLYFAENEDVARGYRERLAGTKANEGTVEGAVERALAEDNPRQWLEGQSRSATNALKRYPDNQYLVEQAQRYDDAIKLLEGGYKPAGSMYEVNIAADPEAFLDWDKPLSEQSEQVKAAVGGLGTDYPRVKRQIEEGTLSGPGVYRAPLPVDARHDLPATEFWKQAGIPGIRYLDAGSRPHLEAYTAELKKYQQIVEDSRNRLKADPNNPALKEELIKNRNELNRIERVGPGSRNYVVFDPKLISIVKKYGIAAAIASGVISEEMGRQMQAQGEI